MEHTITEENFASLSAYWKDSSNSLNWSSVFVLPAWMKTWWREFGSGTELLLRAVRQNDTIIGIAPLMQNESTASFVGSVNVCDYLDFIVVPGKEEAFFTLLLDYLQENNISILDLKALRPDSITLNSLIPMCKELGYKITCEEEGVSLELDLPSNWEDYLSMLDKKQRHEVRRKLRRLFEIDNVEYRCIDNIGETDKLISNFLSLFPLSREDKASFMTPKMESFFRSLAAAMAEIGVLRFGLLELNSQVIAMIMDFDYNETTYLYNSAYDPKYSNLSAGVLSKVLCLKESIESGRKKWDFLKGGEQYKYHIGGQEISLRNCRINLK